MERPIAEEEFDRLLATPARSAFRRETRAEYSLGYEQIDFDQWLDGHPTPPPDLDWWRPWLEQIKRLTSEGKQVGRVRVLAEPPSDYQRWLLWADPWHAAAGEDIRYMTLSRAERVGLDLLNDWWLIDDELVILMFFTRDGRIYRKIITDEPRAVARHREWRDLAVRNATPAERFAAA